ncbi:MAG: response regulator [Aggregatilineales bacterium]
MNAQENLRKVLIVEDFAPLQRNLAFLLYVSGFEVITADNGAFALNELRAELPDLVICDAQMPGMDGFALLAEIRSCPQWAHLPVILTSCCCRLDDVVAALELGANDYIPKPYDLYDVLDSIQRVAPHLMPAVGQRIADRQCG